MNGEEEKMDPGLRRDDIIQDSGQQPCRNDDCQDAALGCGDPSAEKAMQQAPNKMRGKARNKRRGYTSRRDAEGAENIRIAALGCGGPGRGGG
jgi:hypothetical protein